MISIRVQLLHILLPPVGYILETFVPKNTIKSILDLIHKWIQESGSTGCLRYKLIFGK